MDYGALSELFTVSEIAFRCPRLLFKYKALSINSFPGGLRLFVDLACFLRKGI
jgi:hypothetical protein